MLGEEVGPKYTLLHVSYNEIEGKWAVAENESLGRLAITWYGSPVCGRKLQPVWSLTTLLRCRRHDGANGAAVAEPFFSSRLIRDVK